MALQDEFKDWLEHPMTKMLRTRCLQNKQLLMEQWASGKFNPDSDKFRTENLNAEAIGKCLVYERIASLELEDIEVLEL